MKMKIISLITIFVFALTLVSAVTIYSGESYNITLEKQFEYYSIVGNSSECDIEVTQNSENVVIIIPNKYSQSDSFEVIFFDIEKEIIVEYHNSGGGGGGGGTRTIYRDKNITKYVDKEIKVEVPGEIITTEVEVEKIVKRASILVWAFIVILLGAIIYLAFFRKQDTIERGYRN